MVFFKYVDRGASKNRIKCIIAGVFFVVAAVAVSLPFGLGFYARTRIVLANGELHRLKCPIQNFDKVTLPEAICINSGCIWNQTLDAPACYLPEQNDYAVKNVQTSERHISVHLEKISNTTFYDEPYEKVEFHAYCISEDQITVQILPKGGRTLNVTNLNSVCNFKTAFYRVDVTDKVDSQFNFNIVRAENNQSIWDTSIGGLILEPHFMQIATFLPSKNIYGFGHSFDSGFRRKFGYETLPMLIRYKSPGDEGLNLYGYNPYYLCIENDGKTHGILFHNLYISDYTLLSSPGFSLRAIGGDLSFTILLGQRPEDIYKKLANIIGKPALPPYWALGFHLTVFRDDDILSAQSSISQGIYVDAVHLHPDLWHRREVFSHRSLQNTSLSFIQNAKNNNLHWIVMIDPAVHDSDKYSAYKEGTAVNAFIKLSSDDLQNGGEMYATRCGYENVAYPDLMTEKSQKWWKSMIRNLQSSFHDFFGGAIMMMNVPCSGAETCERQSCLSILCPENNAFDYPKYMPDFGNAQMVDVGNKTICMSGVHGEGTDQLRHLQVHTTYGMLISALTQQSCEESGSGQRCFIMSRSTSLVASMIATDALRKQLPTVGLWLGNDGHFGTDRIHTLVIKMLEANLFGVSYVGGDVCGYETLADVSLCKAWIHSAVLSPFFRMRHSHLLKNSDVLETLHETLKMRYSLLPYMYTVFYDAATDGNAVIRPLFYEYPNDTYTYEVDAQYMFGRSLMIASVLRKAFELEVYFPNDVWYRMYEHFGTIESNPGTKRKVGDLHSPLIYVRGGSIIPQQDSQPNGLHTSHSNRLTLAVYHKERNSEGYLFWDDGISQDTLSTGRYFYFTFHHVNCMMRIHRSHIDNDVQNHLFLKKIVVNTFPRANTVYVNGKLQKPPSYDFAHKYVTMEVDINLTDLSEAGDWKIDWGC